MYVYIYFKGWVCFFLCVCKGGVSVPVFESSICEYLNYYQCDHKVPGLVGLCKSNSPDSLVLI